MRIVTTTTAVPVSAISVNRRLQNDPVVVDFTVDAWYSEESEGVYGLSNVKGFPKILQQKIQDVYRLRYPPKVLTLTVGQ